MAPDDHQDPATSLQESAESSAGDQATPVPAINLPRPGIDGEKGCMDGVECVLTGLFPEAGDCKIDCEGLDIGKARVIKMVESFGGRATKTKQVSKNTNILIVGEEPGMKKVAEARRKGLPLVHLETLKDRIKQTLKDRISVKSMEPKNVPLMLIDSFSSGGYGNSRAFVSDPDEIAFASGINDVPEHVLHAALDSFQAVEPEPGSSSERTTGVKRRRQDEAETRVRQFLMESPSEVHPLKNLKRLVAAVRQQPGFQSAVDPKHRSSPSQPWTPEVPAQSNGQEQVQTLGTAQEGALSAAQTPTGVRRDCLTASPRSQAVSTPSIAPGDSRARRTLPMEPVCAAPQEKGEGNGFLPLQEEKEEQTECIEDPPLGRPSERHLMEMLLGMRSVRGGRDASQGAAAGDAGAGDDGGGGGQPAGRRRHGVGDGDDGRDTGHGAAAAGAGAGTAVTNPQQPRQTVSARAKLREIVKK